MRSVIIVLLLLVGSVDGIERGSHADRVFNYLVANPRTADLEIITSDIREKVMNELYRFSFPDTDQGMHSQAQTVLFRLWDENSVNRLIDLYRDGHDGSIGSAIADSAQPRIIPYMAADFLREDGDAIEERREDDIVITNAPTSLYVSEVVLRLIANCDHFGSDVRSWAAVHEPFHVAYRIRPKLYRKMMADWWRENEQFFREKNYKAVRPGRSLATAAIESSPPSTQATGAVLSEKRPGDTAGSRVGTSASEPEGSKSAPLWVYYTSAIAAVLALVALVWHRCKRARKASIES